MLHGSINEPSTGYIDNMIWRKKLLKLEIIHILQKDKKVRPTKAIKTEEWTQKSNSTKKGDKSDQRHTLKINVKYVQSLSGQKLNFINK